MTQWLLYPVILWMRAAGGDFIAFVMLLLLFSAVVVGVGVVSAVCDRLKFGTWR